MVQGGVSEVQNFLAGQGLNADVLANDVRKASGTASDALTQAKPTVDSTVVTLSRSSPALLAEYALGAVALYYFVSLPQYLILTLRLPVCYTVQCVAQSKLVGLKDMLVGGSN